MNKVAKIELVETHNLSVSLKRVYHQSNGFDEMRWRRTLLHAIAIAGVAGFDTQRKIREALGLP